MCAHSLWPCLAAKVIVRWSVVCIFAVHFSHFFFSRARTQPRASSSHARAISVVALSVHVGLCRSAALSSLIYYLFTVVLLEILLYKHKCFLVVQGVFHSEDRSAIRSCDLFCPCRLGVNFQVFLLLCTRLPFTFLRVHSVDICCRQAGEEFRKRGVSLAEELYSKEASR